MDYIDGLKCDQIEWESFMWRFHRNEQQSNSGPELIVSTHHNNIFCGEPQSAKCFGWSFTAVIMVVSPNMSCVAIWQHLIFHSETCERKRNTCKLDVAVWQR